MRRFELHRDEDVSGISGTGVVAEGVAFSDGGPVALRWTSEWPTSVVFHDLGVESLEAVHGHNGRTRIVWLDAKPESAEPKPCEMCDGHGTDPHHYAPQFSEYDIDDPRPCPDCSGTGKARAQCENPAATHDPDGCHPYGFMTRDADTEETQ